MSAKRPQLVRHYDDLPRSLRLLVRLGLGPVVIAYEQLRLWSRR